MALSALVAAVFLGGLLWGAYSLGSLTPSSACTFGNCPTELHAYDTGKQFTYAVGTTLTVILDQTKDPRAHLRCSSDALVESAGAPDQVAPLYAVAYRAQKAGTCILEDDQFFATIYIE